jgi:hypothetical protein
MTEEKDTGYHWCQHYGGPKDGYWCSTGDTKADHHKGQLSYRDADDTEHFYVLLKSISMKEPDLLFYAYAGTDREKIWSNVIVGHPGCNKNNYDPDLEPEWYNWDKD